jgi:hypothetical protein
MLADVEPLAGDGARAARAAMDRLFRDDLAAQARRLASAVLPANILAAGEPPDPS